MVKSRDVKSIRGNEIEHFAHKADVIRLEALRDWGGIYLDTDVVVVRGEWFNCLFRAIEPSSEI